MDKQQYIIENDGINSQIFYLRLKASTLKSYKQLLNKTENGNMIKNTINHPNIFQKIQKVKLKSIKKKNNNENH